MSILLVALVLPTASFAEEIQSEPSVTSEEESAPSVGSGAPQSTDEAVPMLFDAEDPEAISVTSEEMQMKGAEGEEQIMTMTSEEVTPEQLEMVEDISVDAAKEDDTAVLTDGQVTDDLKRTVTLMESAETESGSSQNILLYTVIAALLAVIVALGTLVYRRRQQ
jgi:hypothetical protein